VIDWFLRLKTILADGGYRSDEVSNAKKKHRWELKDVLRPNECPKKNIILPISWIVERLSLGLRNAEDSSLISSSSLILYRLWCYWLYFLHRSGKVQHPGYRSFTITQNVLNISPRSYLLSPLIRDGYKAGI
jgi:hypothetical protein